jgi:hypothetical protein
MLNDWVKVFEINNLYRAEIIKGVLEENEIETVVIPKKDSMYQIGNFHIMVHSDDFLKALNIINEDIKFE